MYLRNNHENIVSVSALVKFKHHIKLDGIQVPLFAVAAFVVPGCVEVTLFPKFSTFTSSVEAPLCEVQNCETLGSAGRQQARNRLHTYLCILWNNCHK